MSAFSEANRRVMARDDSENFRVRPGRSRNGGARIDPRTQPFLKQVQIAVRKAGGDPQRWARPVAGKEAGRVGSTRVAELRRSWPPFLGRVRRGAGKEIQRAGSPCFSQLTGRPVRI
jgi:hypothetical protein